MEVLSGCVLSAHQDIMEETSMTKHSMVLSHQVKDQVHRGQKSGVRKQAGHEKHLIKEYQNPGVVVNACNTTLQEVEAGEVPRSSRPA